MSVLVILLVLMIIGAIIAIETTNLLSSIVSLGAVGFLLSISFLFLGAPDIAITQLVVEILCLVILIRATISRDLTTVTGDREFVGLATTVGLVLVVTIIGVNMFAGFPAMGSSVTDRVENEQGVLDAPARRYLEKGHEETGASNAVTAILLDYRAYDTLGEATVLFCSVLGALAILRKTARKRKEDEDTDP